jgi:prepilin-type processing-associated H-X9-DG protein
MSARAGRGITRAELLVVVALLAFFVGVLLPGVAKGREIAARLKCQNNLRRVGQALHKYHDDHGAFPPGQPQGYFTPLWSAEVAIGALNDNERSCWAAHVLAHLEQLDVAVRYYEFLKAPTVPVYTTPFANTLIPVLICPSDPDSPKVSTLGQGFHTSYVTCLGDSAATPPEDPRGWNRAGMFFGFSRVRLDDVTDGTANTVMASELLQVPDTATAHDVRGRIWNSLHAGTEFTTLHPPNAAVGDNPMGYCVHVPEAPCGPGSVENAFTLARSRHPGGVNTCMADGSIRFVRNSIDARVWAAMGTRAGGERLE